MTILFNKYKVLEKIGNGSFGEIYKGKNVRTNEYVAIKVESILDGKQLLKNEARIYKYLHNCKGIPIIKWYGVRNQHNFMILNLLGNTLESFKLLQPTKSFTLAVTLNIGYKILELLELIHNKGIIHRDIKPDNFLFSLESTPESTLESTPESTPESSLESTIESSKLNLIDFGFCKTYLTPENKHIEPKQHTSLIGTPNYASINSHNFIELSRRDDLESLGYLLLYLFMGKLPWANTSNNHTIKQMKIDIIPQLPHVLRDYFTLVKLLNYKQRPDYQMLRSLFSSLKNT